MILDFHFFLPCEDFRLAKILYACQSSFEVQINITVFFLQILININLEDIG
jgi:hypothetical protein